MAYYTALAHVEIGIIWVTYFVMNNERVGPRKCKTM